MGKTAGGKLLFNTGNPDWCSVMTWRSGGGEGRVAQKGRDVCVLRGDLHCCTEETNTTCKAIFPQIKHRLKRTIASVVQSEF